MNSLKNRPLEKRVEESDRILNRYPDRIPIIVERYNQKTPELTKYKFLVPKDASLSMLICHVKNRIKLNQIESIFLFANGNIYNPSTSLQEIYDSEKNEDRFLYFVYSTENTFG